MHQSLHTPAILEQNHAKILEWISLPHLLPILKSNSDLLSTGELDRISDEHQTVIERTSYLLQSVRKKGQRGVKKFVQCIQEEKDHPGHRRILNLLEDPPPPQEPPLRCPILEILDEQLNTIASQIDMTKFLNALTNSGAIAVNTFMDVSSPDRTTQENLIRLFKAIEKRGAAGFISFVQGFQQMDAPPAHEHLAKLLISEVQKFLKQRSRREKLSSSDEILLLQLVSREKSELELESKFKQHKTKLVEGINVPALLPYLQKHQVISHEESEKLNSTSLSQRTAELLHIVSSKGPQALPKFFDCLSESPEHKALGSLFGPYQTTRPPKKPYLPGAREKYDKVAVLVCMDDYVDLDEDYRPNKKEMTDYNPRYKQQRDRLEDYLQRMGFHLVSLGPKLAEMEEEGAFSSDISTRIMDCFQQYVVACCETNAIVFIYISGIQFPYKHSKETGARTHDAYSAGILLQGRSEVSRKPLECIRTQDLRHWVEFLPTPYVTFLIDTHQSHIAAFGKQKQPTEVEIMPDPWKRLTNSHSNVVLYFVRPDEKAFWKQRGKEASKTSVFGLLTEKFVEVLISWNRRSQPEVSHRLFYEGVSFHWHEKGKCHLLYNPTFQGDVDRVFLGKSSSPYHQVFRTDLLRLSATDEPTQRFNLKELQVATGTMAGLIRGDELEIFHTLRPEVRVKGRITKAYQLSSIAEVDEKDVQKFHQVLHNIYENVSTSKDGSTEFVFAEKKFPLHMREDCAAVFLEGLDEDAAGTIQSYTKDSSLLLSAANKIERAKLVVKCEGEFFVVEDLMKDIGWKARVKTAQHVKSMLEMMAWYKYVKRLKPQQKTPHLHSCFLTAEKQLLSRAIPLSAEFTIKWSSSEPHPAPQSPHPPRPQDAILQFSDPIPVFWVPSHMDQQPCIEVEFKENHVITAIEIRGNAQENRFVKTAAVVHQKLVRTGQEVYEGPTSAQSSKTIDLHCQEAVRFVTIVPETWSGDSFNFTVKMKHSVSGQKGASLNDIDAMTVVNWPYHQQHDTPWRFVPPPDPAGVINLNSAYHWLSWSGSTRDPLTFDLGGPRILEKLEITTITETNHLERFRLRLQTSWFRHDLPETPTVWPTKHEIEPRPLVVSNLQLWPLQTNTPTLQGNIRLQLQLYGNKQGEKLSVEEGSLLTFHFSNHSQQQLFVYLFCLEETGMVKLVHFEFVQKEDSYKKFLRTSIPDDYNPLTKQITDIYKVFVSPKKMYLEPFLQRGLHEYHCASNYGVYSLGRRSDIGRDEQWYQYEFRVTVKMSSRQ